MTFLLLFVGVIAAIIAAIYQLYSQHKAFKLRLKSLKPLPGPKGWPVVGSALELPARNQFLKLHEWRRQYGPIFTVNIAGHDHIWLCQDRMARDLLAGPRKEIYSNRPHIPGLVNDNRYAGHYLPLMSKTDSWGRQKRFSKMFMDKSTQGGFFGYPELEATRLLADLMRKPEEYFDAMESYVARVTSRLAWGAPEASEELRQRARELLFALSPSGSLANKLPVLMSLPPWLSKQKSWELRRVRTERKWFEMMQKECAENPSAGPSWMRTYLEDKVKASVADDLEAAYDISMHAIAGAFTIAVPMQSFLMALCSYPQFQPMLHEEIDRVVGNRPPTWGDMSSMPILRAFIRETMRWRPPVPSGIPRDITEDGEYDGYLIPKGSFVHPFEWAICRDPEMYPDAEDFNPSRWLEPGYPSYQEPLSKYPRIAFYSQFGYGNRICPGMTLTEADLFVSLGAIAWLFTVLPPKSTEVCHHRSDSGTTTASSGPDTKPLEEERVLPDTLNLSTLLIAKPLPFNFELQIRNADRAKKVLEDFAKYEADETFAGPRVYWKDEKGEPANLGDDKIGWNKITQEVFV